MKGLLYLLVVLCVALPAAWKLQLLIMVPRDSGIRLPPPNPTYFFFFLFRP